MSEKRLRVVRVLVYDGPREWVEHTLKQSWVQGEMVYGSSKVIETIVDRRVYAEGKEDDTQG